MHDQSPDPSFNLEINRRHAIWTALRIQLRHPELVFQLFVHTTTHFLTAACPASQAAALANEVTDTRPAGCNVQFTAAVPGGSQRVDMGLKLEDELWMSHEPLRMVDLQRMLCIAAADLPEGELTLDERRRVWEFRTVLPLASEGRKQVTSAFQSLGWPGSLEFVEGPDPAPAGRSPVTHPHGFNPANLELRSSGELRGHPLRQLVEKDEAEWREFLGRRQTRALNERSTEPNQLACAWAGEDESEVQLGELLTMYDRVDFIAPAIGMAEGGILRRLGLRETQFQELVASGHLRLVLPKPLFQYESNVVQMASEAKASSVILSRSLAAAVMEQGQRKDPLLYGPFSSLERAALMGVLAKVAPPQHPLRSILTSYAKTLESQNLFLMERGAQAFLTHGVGTHIAHVLEARTGDNRHLELMTTGAQVEWSLGLGAAYIPPVIGGFATDRIARMIASYYGGAGRTASNPADPFANRIHTVVNALLVPTDVPPLEVVRNLHSGSLQRFRSVARKLMTQTATQEELDVAVAQVNADIRTYEGRLEKLRTYGMSGLAGTAVHHGLAHGLHTIVGFAGSVLAMWLAEMILDRAGEHNSPLLAGAGSLTDTLRGLLLAPSLDAVIVRQLRNEVGAIATPES